MSGYAKERAHERIRAASRGGRDVAGFLAEARDALASAVPNENHLDGPYWYTLDPQSRLITSDYGGEGCELDTSDVMRWEYLDDDVNKYAEVLDHPAGVQTLHEVTRGKPERSRIYREYMVAEDIGQEMLVALGTGAGEFWGTVRLNRLCGQVEFGADEVAFMAAVAPDLAEGIRRGLLFGEASDPDGPDAPGLIVLDAAGEIVSLSAGAGRWIERLSDGSARGALPAPVVSAAAAAVASARGEDPAAEATVVARSIDGRWVSVHGTVLGTGRTARAAVIIEPAHPDRITPLLLAVHGLTRREQEIAGLVLRGRSTAQLASRLGISPHTVQQHLKSIFDKVGVRSRRELVASLFFEHYEPRVEDNGARVLEEKPIRGGPLSRPH